MLLFIVDEIIYEHLESVYLVCFNLFCQRNGYFFTLHHLWIKLRLELCLHNNDFFPPYLDCNWSSKIQILVNHSKNTSQPLHTKKLKINFSSQFVSRSLQMKQHSKCYFVWHVIDLLWSPYLKVMWYVLIILQNGGHEQTSISQGHTLI